MCWREVNLLLCLQVSVERLKAQVLLIRVQDITLGILCCLGIYLLRFRETYRLHPTWHIDIDTAAFANHKYRSGEERLLAPLVTDLDSDGINEVVLITTRMQLQVLVVPQLAQEKMSRLPQPVIKQAAMLGNQQHPDGKPSYPVAIETGFLEQINGSKARSQVGIISREKMIYDEIHFLAYTVICWNNCTSVNSIGRLLTKEHYNKVLHFIIINWVIFDCRLRKILVCWYEDPFW